MKWFVTLFSFFRGLFIAATPTPTSAPVTVVDVPIVATTTLPVIQPTMTNQENLYREAKVCLGYPQKLDASIPNLLACASSLSGVLKKAGFEGLPPHGIGGTEALNMFFSTNAQLQSVPENNAEAGDIIISPSNTPGAVLQHGHCGVVGNSGIMSNDSDTGLWRESWTFTSWVAYYQTYGKLSVLVYRWTGDKV